MLPLSNKSWTARVYLPSLLVVGYCFLVLAHDRDGHTFPAAIFLSPCLMIALWLIFVPVDLQFIEAERCIRIFRWRFSAKHKIGEVGRVQHIISIFSVIVLESGERYLYIVSSQNEQLRQELQSNRTI
jgi:hypothetical protein